MFSLINQVTNKTKQKLGSKRERDGESIDKELRYILMNELYKLKSWFKEMVKKNETIRKMNTGYLMILRNYC